MTCYTSDMAGTSAEAAGWDDGIAVDVAARIRALPWYYAVSLGGLLRALEYGVLPLAGRRFSRLPLPDRKRWLDRFKRRAPGGETAERALGMMTTVAFLERARHQSP